MLIPYDCNEGTKIIEYSPNTVIHGRLGMSLSLNEKDLIDI
jgi:hypothetical protein